MRRFSTAVKQIISEAQQAFNRGEHAHAQELLQPLADAGNLEAQALLGTWCMWELAKFDDAERWLRSAADAGHGHAAHNLAVLYSRGWPGRESDKTRAATYFQIAVDAGFEASVANDPLWWKRR